MTYQTVYEASPFTRDWLFVIPGLIGLTIGTLLVFKPNVLPRRFPEKFKHGQSKLFNWAFFLFALVWVVSALTVMTADIFGSSDASKRNTCRTIQGKVAGFVPMPWGGHAQEHFTVNGVPFAYSDFQHTGGFNNTSAYGGPIREGRAVRICYVERQSQNIIVRLEIDSSRNETELLHE